MFNACFTGHRKISNSYYNPENPTPEWAALKEYMRHVVGTLVANNITLFYSGMAIGVDMLAAEVVLEIKAAFPQIALHAAVPFPSQPSNWPKATQDRYYSILSQCNITHTINQDPYTPWKMHARDRFMVDNSQYVVSVWDGNPGGGTYYTTRYAQEVKRMIFRVNPLTITGAWLEEDI